VAVRAEVDRHVVDRQREVGSVIEVEAAEEILVGLAATGMLGGDQARRCLEQLTGAKQRSDLDVRPGDAALARRAGRADPLLAAAFLAKRAGRNR
jgi:hypothetical protein